MWDPLLQHEIQNSAISTDMEKDGLAHGMSVECVQCSHAAGGGGMATTAGSHGLAWGAYRGLRHCPNQGRGMLIWPSPMNTQPHTQVPGVNTRGCSRIPYTLEITCLFPVGLAGTFPTPQDYLFI